jgi:hypothetical protein
MGAMSLARVLGVLLVCAVASSVTFKKATNVSPADAGQLAVRAVR